MKNIFSKKDIRRLALVMLGAGLMAFNITGFIRSGNLYPGGASGLTLVLQEVFLRYMGLNVPYTMINLLLNAVPFYISFRFIGRRFSVYSLLAVVFCSVLADIIPSWLITQDKLLCAVFGGLLNGIAISLCLFGDATTGGTDIISIFVSQRYKRDAWSVILAGNCILLFCAGLMFGWERALYSISFQYTTTQVLHTLYRRYQQRTLLIVTRQPQPVFDAIVKTTNHSATLLKGVGLYENREQSVLYSVVSAEESRNITDAVLKLDPGAFINVLPTDRVGGRFYTRPND